MQNKHQFFFLVLGVPTLGEGEGGSTWLGQIPKFFQKLDLKAPLIKPGKTSKYINIMKAGANATLVEREKLIYPLASLVSCFLKF